MVMMERCLVMMIMVCSMMVNGAPDPRWGHHHHHHHGHHHGHGGGVAALAFLGGLAAGSHHSHHHGGHHHGGGGGGGGCYNCGCGGCGGGSCGWCGGGYGRRRKRSIEEERFLDDENIKAIYEEIASEDIDGCGLRLVCELAYKDPRDLKETEINILLPYQGAGESDGTVYGNYDEAAWHGQEGHSCSAIYKQCNFDANQIMNEYQQYLKEEQEEEEKVRENKNALVYEVDGENNVEEDDDDNNNDDDDTAENEKKKMKEVKEEIKEVERAKEWRK